MGLLIIYVKLAYSQASLTITQSTDDLNILWCISAKGADYVF